MLVRSTTSNQGVAETQQGSQILSESERENATELTKDQFFELLVTQLRYQDPMQPVNDQEFLAQLAQFSALEQMNNLTKSIDMFTSMTQAASLLGKEVDVLDPETDTIVSGTVSQVSFVDGVPKISIGNGTYSVWDVQTIRA